MSKPLRLSDLSFARQALVRLCQDVNFGQILDLRVGNAERRYTNQSKRELNYAPDSDPRRLGCWRCA